MRDASSRHEIGLVTCVQATSHNACQDEAEVGVRGTLPNFVSLFQGVILYGVRIRWKDGGRLH